VTPSYSGSCVAASATQLIKDFTYDYPESLGRLPVLRVGRRQRPDHLRLRSAEPRAAGDREARVLSHKDHGLVLPGAHEPGDAGVPVRRPNQGRRQVVLPRRVRHRISLRNDPVDSAQAIMVYTYAYDVHGSVSALIDSSKNVVAAYDAYGLKDAGISGGDSDDNNPLNPYLYRSQESASTVASEVCCWLHEGCNVFQLA
jgi:hypothetical protein